MKINFEEKLRYGDLSFEFKDGLQVTLRERIKADNELMNEIKNLVREEDPDIEANDAKKFEAYVDLKVDEVAGNAVDAIKIYCEFDLEVNI